MDYVIQSSYGQLPGNAPVIGFTSQETGMTYRETVQVGQSVPLPEDRIIDGRLNIGTGVRDGRRILGRYGNERPGGFDAHYGQAT